MNTYQLTLCMHELVEEKQLIWLMSSLCSFDSFCHCMFTEEVVAWIFSTIRWCKCSLISCRHLWSLHSDSSENNRPWSLLLLHRAQQVRWNRTREEDVYTEWKDWSKVTVCGFVSEDMRLTGEKSHTVDSSLSVKHLSVSEFVRDMGIYL